MNLLLIRGSGVVLLAAVAIPAWGQSATTPSETPKSKVHVSAHATQDPAERAFQAHCIRCHTAPESLSPSLTGTVVRHMRVRANLSAEEERLILSYFNP